MAETERGTSPGRTGPPHHATVVAWLALFIALGGVASGLPGNNTVTPNDIRTGAVSSPEIRDAKVKAVDLAPDAVGTDAIADGAVGPLQLGPIPAARIDTPQQSPGCTSQVIESGPAETLQFSVEAFDTQNLHTPPPGDCTAGTQSRLTAPIDGIYVAAAQVTWPSNSTNQRFLHLTRTDVGGTTDLAVDGRPALSGVGTQHTVSAITDLDAGDYVEAAVSQDSGVGLALTSVFNNHLSLVWIGPGD